VVVHSHTTDGNAMWGATPFKMQTREQCCFRALMIPAYQQMVADGVTCIIRGKRREELEKSGVEPGHISAEGVEIVFPIYDWTSEDVRVYLQEQGVELPKFYQYGDHSHDCMHCTAWWDNRHGEYLAAEHPETYKEWLRRITLIKQVVKDQMAVLGE